MLIELPSNRDVKALAVAAGFSSVEDYVAMLIERDAERIAIQEGIDDMNAGRTQPWSDVDSEIRREFGFPPRT